MYGWHIVWFYARKYGYQSKEHREALSTYRGV
jgi:hypothetical protein